MHRFLFLDDDNQRHMTFTKRYWDNERVHVNTFERFCDAINGPKFDVIFLDHDLNDFGENSIENGTYGTRELTGYDCCVMLAKLPDDKRPNLVIIHSWNTPGATRMAAYLKDFGFSVVVDPFYVD
jgi:hypothetical protein